LDEKRQGQKKFREGEFVKQKVKFSFR